MNVNTFGYKRVLRKRKLLEDKKVKKLKSSKKDSSSTNYHNVLQEHNYFSVVGKKSSRWPNKNTSSENLTDTLLLNETNYDSEDSLPDCVKGFTDVSDEECIEDEENIPLSLLLKIEYDKDLLKENLLINHSHNSSLINSNPKAVKLINNQDLNEILIMKPKNIVNLVMPMPLVPPPLDWFHIIYLAIKNSQFEYVTCHDVQCFARYWFPYYCNKTCIRMIKTTFNYYSKKYFSCLLSLTTHNNNSNNMWTVKYESVKMLEDKLLYVVEKFEDYIKSALRDPDYLPIILKGYGVFKLGYSNMK